MAPSDAGTDQSRYASLGLRFQAFWTDFFILLGVFVVGGIAAGIAFESHPGARIAAFGLILIFVLGYEPFMVARYGGTVGHRRANIRISCTPGDAKLPFWRAAVRFLVKEVLGVVSFFFMFITDRAQGFHDLIAGSAVVIRDPSAARPEDYFHPKQRAQGQPVSPLRRIAVTVLYNAMLVLLLGVAGSKILSQGCLSQNDCRGTENMALSILGSVWLVAGLASIVLGWTGRLPGCRPRVQA